jgi:hypothetical protein
MRKPYRDFFQTLLLQRLLFQRLLAAAAVVAASGPAAVAWAAEPQTIVLSGTMTPADKGTYQEHPFQVPAGVTRLDVEFSYQNKGAGTELEIGLFDARRFRGTSRFSKQRFYLTEFEATPSYVAGPLLPGTWRLSLGIPSIGAGTTSEWRATIRLSSDPTPREGLAPALKTEAGWYVGDLHAHTLHSDGYGCEDPSAAGVRRGCQPWEVVEAARARHLDFLAITDHNTTTHHADLATLQESLTTMLLLRGQELTTFHGHANVYGTSRVIDFRLGFKGRTMVDVMNDVGRQGALLSINHPGRDTGDRCTGCGWDAPQTPWDRIEAMEVINGGVIEGRTAGMPFWYARLNEGHRLTGIGGGDDHAARSAHGRVGSPATVIYARELSEAALIDGIRAGRVYVRTRGPEGPAIDISASAGGQQAQMGGVLRVAPGAASAVRLEVRVQNASSQKAEVVRNGEVIATLDVSSDDATLSQAVELTAGQWVHVRLRDAKGITAFANPIYGRAASAPTSAGR